MARPKLIVPSINSTNRPVKPYRTSTGGISTLDRMAVTSLVDVSANLSPLIKPDSRCPTKSRNRSKSWSECRGTHSFVHGSY